MENEHFRYQGDENDLNRNNNVAFTNGVCPHDFTNMLSYVQGYPVEEYSNGFRGNRGSFRPRGRGWMGIPRFRGRGFNHAPRPRGFHHPRGGHRFPPPEWGGPCRPPPRFPSGVPLPNLALPPPALPPPPCLGPPPNVPAPDLWVETRTEDNRFYYYLARTRETTWVRPQESPTCKVLPYEEVQAMVQSGTLPAAISQTLPLTGEVATRTTEDIVLPPWSSPHSGHAAPQRPYHHNYTSGVDPERPSNTATPQPAKPTTIPPEVEEEASKWSTHLAPDGRTYYYNQSQGKSVWVKPGPLAVMEELKRKIAEEQGIAEIIEVNEGKIEVIDVDAHAEACAKAEAEREAELERQAEAQRLAEIERQAAAELEAENRREADALEQDMAQLEIEKEREKEEKKEKRPIYYCTHFYNTPWQVVWTEEGSVFFYNPSGPVSVWTRPADIQGREDVDLVVSRPPPALRARLEQQRALASKPPPHSDSSDSDAASSEEEDRSEPDQNEPKTSEDNDELEQQRAFRTLMEEAKLTSKSSYLEFTIKFGRDPRFKGLLNARVRETQFAEYIAELRRRDARREKAAEAKVAFIAMLKEKGIERGVRWSEAKKKLEGDARYKALEGSSVREAAYSKYQHMLTAKRERDKSKEKDSNTDKTKIKKEKSQPEKKQPTPPPEEWADILGIPGERGKATQEKEKAEKLGQDKGAQEKTIALEKKIQEKTLAPEKALEKMFTQEKAFEKKEVQDNVPSQEKLEKEKAIALEKRLAQEKAAAFEKKLALEKAAALEKKIAQEKAVALEKKIAHQKAAALEKRLAHERALAQEKALSQEKALEKKLAQEKIQQTTRAEEKTLAEVKAQAHEKTLTHEKRLAHERRISYEKSLSHQKDKTEIDKRLTHERVLTQQRTLFQERMLAQERAQQKALALQKSLAEEATNDLLQHRVFTYDRSPNQYKSYEQALLEEKLLTHEKTVQMLEREIAMELQAAKIEKKLSIDERKSAKIEKKTSADEKKTVKIEKTEETIETNKTEDKKISKEKRPSVVRIEKLSEKLLPKKVRNSEEIKCAKIEKRKKSVTFQSDTDSPDPVLSPKNLRSSKESPEKKNTKSPSKKPPIKADKRKKRGTILSESEDEEIVEKKEKKGLKVEKKGVPKKRRKKSEKD